VHAEVECKILGGGEAEAGGEESFNRGVAGLVQVQDGAFHRFAVLESIEEGGGLAGRYSDADEDYCELDGGLTIDD
jgi:hypothetical protein